MPVAAQGLVDLVVLARQGYAAQAGENADAAVAETL